VMDRRAAGAMPHPASQRPTGPGRRAAAALTRRSVGRNGCAPGRGWTGRILAGNRRAGSSAPPVPVGRPRRDRSRKPMIPLTYSTAAEIFGRVSLTGGQLRSRRFQWKRQAAAA
jgi:hypothetical protein